MTLTTGTRLGVYEVVALIGAGGMGEVYRARDTRLGRDVALKVLPEVFSRDVQRMARFEREARMLASLNHPNIAAIYGLEESGPIRALVMELVEGPTLAERIAAGAIPVDEALPIAKQVADAVEYAHDKNVIHRDLKPANIKVTADGTVKVLDFGLAKAMSEELTETDINNSPTLSMAATRQGMILGTAAYMSPEQAKGRVVDRRADVWAFGAVLYEMLAGKQAFHGEDLTEVLAAVVKSEPALDALPAITPPAIRNLLRRCLEKNLKRRLSHIGEARILIEDSLSGAAAAGAEAAASMPGLTPPAWRRALPWSVAAVLAVFAGITFWSPWRAAPASPVVARFTVSLQPGEQLAPQNGGLAVSPDGRYIAYTSTPSGGTRQLFLRPMDRDEATPIPGTEGAGGLFFSPDSQWIAFTAAGKLKKVPVAGGTPIVLCDRVAWNTGSWGPDGTILFGEDAAGKLMSVPAAGGTPQVVTTIQLNPGDEGDRWLEVLPGGNAFLGVTRGTQGAFSDDATIFAQSLKTGERKTLIQGGTSPHYLSTGHLVYAQGGRLLAVPFDLRRLEVTGAAAPILEDVWQGGSGYAAYGLSRAGSLAYMTGGEAGGTQLSTLNWVDRSGAARQLGDKAHKFGFPSLSPDGQRVAVINADTTATPDVWVFDLTRSTLTRLTFAKPGEQTVAEVWTPDGKRVIYSLLSGTEFKLMWRPADGSGTEEMLFSGNDWIYPMTCSPDGQLLVFGRLIQNHRDLWVLPLVGDHKARPLIESAFNKVEAQVSPDGRWLAYASNESGHLEVYVQPFPGLGGKWQVSTKGGLEPRWSRDGRQLVYSNDNNKMMAVEVETRSGFAAGSPRLLFDQPYAHGGMVSDYDMAPDGQHFVMLKVDEAQSAQFELRVVLNWAEEVTRRLGAVTK